MSKVIFLPPPPSSSDRERALWARYVDARNKAEKTCDIRDGIAAGMAWAAWLDLFRTIYP